MSASGGSKTDKPPAYGFTRSGARRNISSKGSKWYQFDFATYSAIYLLYIVEWADWNSQAKIGKGYTDTSNSELINNGGTDSMTFHTGRASGTDGKTAVQYRWIENLWGNIGQFVDGINLQGSTAYVCVNPANYADDTCTNYTRVGDVSLPSADDFIGRMSPGSLDWCLLPVGILGSSSTKVTDFFNKSNDWTVLNVGGYWSEGSKAGLFRFNGANVSSERNTMTCVRLILLP